MKNINVLQTPIRFSPAIGGVENHVYFLSKELIDLGNNVAVICANEPKSSNSEINDIKVTRLNYQLKVTNTNICLSLPFTILKSTFDVIHTHMPTPWSADWSILLAKIMKRKSVITIHNDMDKPGFLSFLLTKVYLNTFFKLSLFFVDKIIIVNPTWEVSFSATKGILKRYKDKIIVIANGIDSDLFKKEDESQKQKDSILFVSLLDKYHTFKGLEYLLEAIVKVKKVIPDVTLKIVGEGELKKYYQNIAHKLDIDKNIEFIGEVEQKKLSKYYNQASIFVLPSTEIEGFGIVALEAMACELPVIVTTIVGTSIDIEKYRTGLVIKPKDSVAIANAIIMILKNKELSNEMAKNGRTLIEKKYQWKLIANQIQEVYRELGV